MDLPEITAALEKLDALSIEAGVSRHFLQVFKTGAEKEEIMIQGNTEGLVHLAMVCLNLAQKKIDGSHHHFDEVSIVDKSEAPLVIAYKGADWDDEKGA